MDEKPCGESLKSKDVNKDDYPREKNCAQDFKKCGDRIKRKLAEKPPKKQREPWEEQSYEWKPETEVVHKSIFIVKKVYQSRRESRFILITMWDIFIIMRQPPLSHAGLHLKCMVRMLKERVTEGKHRGKVWCHLKFYGKGILRSLGIMLPV
jgi:hypothetical protein